jgi:hypothetical protein
MGKHTVNLRIMINIKSKFESRLCYFLIKYDFFYSTSPSQHICIIDFNYGMVPSAVNSRDILPLRRWKFGSKDVK